MLSCFEDETNTAIHSETESSFTRCRHTMSVEPGMGVEPIYSGSAGRRLNGSATPATYISFETSINRLSTALKLLSDISVNF